MMAFGRVWKVRERSLSEDNQERSRNGVFVVYVSFLFSFFFFPLFLYRKTYNQVL